MDFVFPNLHLHYEILFRKLHTLSINIKINKLIIINVPYIILQIINEYYNKNKQMC